ncbi:hypothetical protein ACJJTC_007613 [Scirpophaga incertulas]
MSGDININISSNSTDVNSNEYFTLLSSHRMLPAYLLPTRGNNCLDHIFVRSPYTATALILNSCITDHYPSLFCLQMEAKRNKTERTDIKADIPAIIKDLEQTNFTSVMSSNNAEAAAQCFVNLISTAIKNNSKIIQSRSKNRIIKTWITPGLLRCIPHRDRLYRKYKQSSCDPRNKLIFTRYCNFFKNLLKKVKKEYERREFEKA